MALETIRRILDTRTVERPGAYVRVLIGGRKSKPLKIATLEPPQPDRHLAESIRQRSRLRYGRPQVDVETAIARRAKLA